MPPRTSHLTDCGSEFNRNKDLENIDFIPQQRKTADPVLEWNDIVPP